MEKVSSRIFPPKGIRNIASRTKEVRSMRRDFFKDPKKGNPMNDPKETLSNFHLWENEEYWKYPIPLIPSHISPRVESHLSRFTLHSLSSYRNKVPNDVPDKDESLYQFEQKAFEEDQFSYLVKIELPSENLANIARILRMTGVGDMNFTQDLDGLSRELQLRAFLGLKDDEEDNIQPT
jgi:hypothetical protein